MAGATVPAPLPAFFDLQAPSSWQAIDFISDLHLSEALPRTFNAFVSHLRNTPAQAVFILGDLFEVWVGDDMAGLDFEHRCVEELASAARHRQLFFMVGNRDFLVGAELLRQSAMLGLPDPTVLQAFGQRVLLSHGDELCLSDTPYQAFRREVRSPAWQSAFLAKPLTERLRIAAEIRKASQTRRQFDGATDTDLDKEETLRWMRGADAQTLVHGHTHRPASHEMAAGMQRHVLSDWDLDQGARAEVLRLTPRGFERLPPAHG